MPQAFSIHGDDDSGPAGDFIMCEGGDLILEADVSFNGNVAYEWAQLRGRRLRAI